MSKSEQDGIDHEELLNYIGETGVRVVDDKRLDGNGFPLPAILKVIGLNGSRQIRILTGSGMTEEYDLTDKDAVEKILSVRLCVAPD